MPTTFANTINGNDIFAARATADASGNNIASTYATQSSVSAIRQVPAAAAADENKVLGVTDAQGSVGWVEGGGVTIHTISLYDWEPLHPRSMIFQVDGWFDENWEGGDPIFNASRSFPREGYEFYGGDENEYWTLNTLDSTNGIYELVYEGDARDWRVDYESTDNWYSLYSLIQNNGGIVQIKMLSLDLTGVTAFASFPMSQNWVTYGNFYLFNTDSVTSLASAFAGTSNYAAVNPSSPSTLYPMSLPNCTSLRAAFAGNGVLSGNIPTIEIPMSVAVDVEYTFQGQTNLTGGISDCYTAWSANSNIVYHTGCFDSTGSGTVSGAAELATVPQSWGGTAV